MNLPSLNGPAGGARTVGILASDLAETYSLRILQGALEELRRNEFSTVCFDGGFPNAPLFHNGGELPVLPSSIDGWIVLPETLRSATPELERAVRACARPVVSVGKELAGVPSIAASDETGVFLAVAHLVRRHGRKRIAFIGGPEASVDAARRREGYRMALETMNLPVDPALFIAGNYEARSGRDAVRQFGRQSNLPFDAIVAANDLMAIGAIEALRANGVRVPDAVSVVGFDDMEEASFASPPLTTVRPPLHEQGESAARTLVRALGGAGDETSRTIGTPPLVVRRSCGCRNSAGNVAAAPGDVAKDPALVEAALRERVRKELSRARRRRELSRLGGAILRALDSRELCPALTEVMTLLGLRRLSLCTYAGAQNQARVTHESTGQGVVFHHESQSFPVEQALPPAYMKHERPVELSIGPVELADEHFGYLVVEGDLRRAPAYFELRQHLGSALGRIASNRELRRLYGERRRTGLSYPPSAPPTAPPLPSPSSSLPSPPSPRR